MDPKGYETKPWWPYVQNLQEQIDAGGSGGGGVASIVVTIDKQAGTATCNATRADILNAAKAPATDLYLNDTNGRQLRYFRMIPCAIEVMHSTENDFACGFYHMDVVMNPNDQDPSLPGSVLDLTYNTFTVITSSREAILRMGLGLTFDVNQTAISSSAPARALVVSMTNI